MTQPNFKKMTVQELKDFVANAVFPDDEGTGIEHVDLSYMDFMKMMDSIIGRIKDDYAN